MVIQAEFLDNVAYWCNMLYTAMALVRNPVGHQTSHPLGVIFHFRSERLGGDRTNTIGTSRAQRP